MILSKKIKKEMNLKLFGIGLIIILMFSFFGCKQKRLPLLGDCNKSMNEMDAKLVVSNIKEGMTLKAVSGFLKTNIYSELPVGEHGGNWLEFCLSKEYKIVLRFSKTNAGNTDSLCYVNLAPELKNNQ